MRHGINQYLFIQQFEQNFYFHFLIQKCKKIIKTFLTTNEEYTQTNITILQYHPLNKIKISITYFIGNQQYQYQMIQQQKLKNLWGVWALFSSDQKLVSEKYKENIQLLFEFASYAEFAFIWNNTKINNLEHFFTNIKNSSVAKFQELDQNRKVQALCFFKSPIRPEWEYGNNGEGGQFVFYIIKQQLNNFQNVYESLILNLIGELFELSNDIIGVRFVDKANLKTLESNIKVQIWTTFNKDAINLINTFTNDLQKFSNTIKLPITKLQFKNNK